MNESRTLEVLEFARRQICDDYFKGVNTFICSLAWNILWNAERHIIGKSSTNRLLDGRMAIL